MVIKNPIGNRKGKLTLICGLSFFVYLNIKNAYGSRVYTVYSKP